MKKIICICSALALGILNFSVEGMIPSGCVPVSSVNPRNSVEQLNLRISALRAANVDENYVSSIIERWRSVLSRGACRPIELNEIRATLEDCDQKWREARRREEQPRIQREQEEQRRREEQARIQREQEQRRREEQARLQREQEQRLREEQARIQREQQEQRLREEQARLQREEEQRRREEQARLQREQEQRLREEQARIQREQQEQRLREENEISQNPEARLRLQRELVEIIKGKESSIKTARLLPYRKAFLGEQDQEKVSKFYNSLSDWDKQCFDMLAIKPLIFHDLLSPRFGGNESEFVKSEIPAIYNAFDGISQLQEIIVKATFKRIISLPIFCSLVREYSSEIPDTRPISVSIILFGLTPEQKRLGLGILDDLTDTGVISLQRDNSRTFIVESSHGHIVIPYPKISSINFSRDRLERTRTRYRSNTAKRTLLAELEKRIIKFENFVTALQNHMNELTIAPEGIDLNRDLVGINGFDQIKGFQESSIEQFITSKQLFEEWKRKFVTDRDDIKALFSVKEIKEKLMMRVGGADITEGVVYPYLRISADSINCINGIIPKAVLPLIEFLYNISVINVMTETYSFGTRNDLPLYEAMLEEKYYPAMNDISTLNEYTMDISTESGNFDLSVLDNLIRDKMLITDEQKLRRTLAYYILKYVYFTATKRDDNAVYGGTKFPAFENTRDCINRAHKAVKEALLRAKYDVPFDTLLDILGQNPNWEGLSDIRRKDADGRANYSLLYSLLAGNGDASGDDFISRVDAILTDLNARYKGGNTISRILGDTVLLRTDYGINRLIIMPADRFNEIGIFAIPSICRFSADILSQILNGELTSQLLQDSNLQILFGNLTNRFAHCESGRFEGALFLFEEMFKYYSSNVAIKNALPFNKLIKIVLYIEAFNIIKRNLDFKKKPNGEFEGNGNTNHNYGNNSISGVSADAEEATYFSYALSVLGRAKLLNLPDAENHLIFIDDGHLLINNMQRMLFFMGIAPPKIALNTKILFNHPTCTDDDQLNICNNGSTSEYADPILVPFLKPFSSLVVPEQRKMYDEIPGLVDQLRISKNDKENLKLCLDIHRILLQYQSRENYDEKICQIARKVLNPSTIIDEMLTEQNQALISMLFDKYKLTRPDIDPGLMFSELTMVDKKRAAFDMLKDSGVLK